MAAEHEPADAGEPVVTLVVLGGEKTGKKTLIQKFNDSIFREQSDPAFHGRILKNRKLDGKEHKLEISTSSSAVSQSSLCQKGQGFILIYAVDDRASFQEIRYLHSQILTLNRKSGRVPVFLAATKADLQSGSSVKLEEAIDLARELGCQKLFEISSKLHQDEINDMFDKLLRESIKNDQQSGSTVVPLNTTLPPSTPIQSPISYDGGSPTAESPRRTSNVFDRLKFGTLKRKTSLQSLTRKKSASFSESLRSFTSQYQGKDMRAVTDGSGLENNEKQTNVPYQLDVDTSSWRETVKWPTNIIPEEELKAHR